MIFKEKNSRIFPAILLLLFSFAAAYQPWIAGTRELFHDEGLYAALASQLNGFPPSLLIGGERIMGEYPLYPLLVRGLCTLGLSMETALRAIPLCCLFMLACIVFYCCYRSAGYQAAFAGSAAVFTCILAGDKTIEGTPVLLGALGIFTTWMIWFDSGSRRGDWRSAWFFSGMIGGLTYYAIGPKGLILTFVPMMFLRRPLGFWTKRRGFFFVLGVILLIVFVILHGFPIWHNPEELPVEPFAWDLPSAGRYLKKFLVFPWDVMFRFLPWTLFLWAPFCPQLAPLDPSPLMSRYLRTLLTVLFCLLWLDPFARGRDIFFLLAPMSALAGLRYWIVVRRYGWTLMKFALWAGLFALLVQAVSLAVLLIPSPERYLKILIPGILPVRFSFPQLVAGFVCAGLGILCVLCALFMTKREYPVWLVITLIFTSFLLAVRGTVTPCGTREHVRREFALRMQRSIPPDVRGKVIYKLDDASPLYSLIHYSGLKVKNIPSARALPQDAETVCVIAREVPAAPEWMWKRLFSEKYLNKTPVEIWQGNLRDEL